MQGMPVATPIEAIPEQLAHVRYNTDGLVAAIVQEHGSGAVLMLGWMNADSLAETLETGRTVFWSRSRRMMSLMSLMVGGSMPVNGSSSRISSGSHTRQRAISSRRVS